MSLETYLWAVAAILSLAVSLMSAGHALLWKRDPRATLGWIGICLTLPLIGAVLYATFGVNRVRRTALQFLERGRRLGTSEGFGVLPEIAEVPGASVVHPSQFEELRELRTLADRVTRMPVLGGNRIEPLENGEEAYPPMLEAIAGATHSIHLSTYIFDGDRVGKRFVEALDAADRRGVTVRVIVDGMGEKYSFPTARRLFAYARSRVKVERFLPLRQGAYLNLRTHRKVLLVDGRLAFTGGMNIGGRHMAKGEDLPDASRRNPLSDGVRRPFTIPGRKSGPVHDMQFRVEGPVVTELQKIFLEDWYFVTGELTQDERLFPPIPAAGGAAARAIADGPDEPARKLNWIILGALSCARRKVRIMTPYFIPDRSLLTAMGTASLRGVDVSLLLPGENNLPFMHWAARSYLWEVIPYGIQVRYQPPPFVHTKMLLVDDLWSLVGSANLDPRSLRLNFELNLEIYDRDTTKGLIRRYDESFERSKPVTVQELDARSLPERLRDGAAKLLSPYL